MATDYQGWLNDGKPFIQCRPLQDLIDTLYSKGYTGPRSGYPDFAHQTAIPPEDHCPFSHTPWPGTQNYPYCNAIDLMPDNGIDVFQVGRNIVRDKLASVPGTEPIKYINWTDVDGQCYHDSWEPNHIRRTSTDTGHVHISTRTDYGTSTIMKSYDPTEGAIMTQADPTQVYNTAQIAYEALALEHTMMGASLYIGGQLQNATPLLLVQRIIAMDEKLDKILTALTTGSPTSTPGVTASQVRAIVVDVLNSGKFE